MSTRVIMHGCNGRMGQVISGLVANDEAVEIVAGVDPFDKVQNTYPVFKTIEECDVEADVIIDFAAATAVDGLLDYAVSKGIGVVLCTFLAPMMGLKPVFSPDIFVQAFGIAIIVGIIGGLYPAIKAVKLPPTEALRYE